jgi:hypothetical protein
MRSFNPYRDKWPEWADVPNPFASPGVGPKFRMGYCRRSDQTHAIFGMIVFPAARTPFIRSSYYLLSESRHSYIQDSGGEFGAFGQTLPSSTIIYSISRLHLEIIHTRRDQMNPSGKEYKENSLFSHLKETAATPSGVRIHPKGY